MKTVRAIASLGASCLLLGACFVSISDLAEQPGGGGGGGLGSAGSADCAPGTLVECYEGPDDTLDVGVCAAGAAPCEGGTCNGQVVPQAERCITEPLLDEDCDGVENDHCGIWNVGFGASSTDAPHDIERLPDGDVVVAGTFGGTVDFGGGNLTAQGSRDGFVVRMKADDGAHVESTRIFGLNQQTPRAITAGLQGELFVVGAFEVEVRIGGMTRTNSADTAMFMARLDALDLSPDWLFAFGSAGDVHVATSVAAAPDGGAVIGGELNGTIALGNGVTASAGADLDAFVAKVDQAGVGVWGYALGAAGEDTVEAVVSDGRGAAYVAGSFTTLLDAGCPGGDLVGRGEDLDGFVMRIDEADGSCDWALSFGGAGAQRGRSLALGDGVLYMVGDFAGEVLLETDAAVSSGDLDLLVLAIEPSAGTITWHRALGDASKQEAWSIAHDPRGGVGIGASIKGEPDFGNGPLITAGAGDDAALVFLGAGGEPRWSRSFGDGGDDDLIDLVIAPTGEVFVTGEFETGLDMGLGFVSGNKGDAFVARLDGDPIGD
jgi:hypothetical protein